MFVFSIIAFLIPLVVFYIRFIYSYWKRQNFPYAADSKIPYGCLEDVVKYKKNMGAAIYDVYLKSREPFVGIYLLFRPALLVRDVKMVRHVLAQDFASFHDRGVYVDEKNDPLSANLFALEGKRWRTMRNMLTSLFTSGKLKNMFGTSEDIGNKMIEHMNTLIPAGEIVELDIIDVTVTYAVDIIASMVFGLDINSFKDPNNDFRTFVRFAQRTTHFNALLNMVTVLSPQICKLLVWFGLQNPNLIKIHEIVRKTIKTREENNIIRKDLLQLLIQLRNKGKVEEDDSNFNWSIENAEEQYKSMSLEAISAHIFLFYLAGQETTGGTAAFTLFELAQYPEVLKKAQEEVHTILAQHNGKVTYESLKEMTYLELCIQETLRKYPGLPMLNRECTQDFTLPGTNKTVKKGTPIVISLFGMHRDAENFPNPNSYIPERFLNCSNNPAYMPFGEGPRHCIAMRMGKINAKLAVVKILQHFKMEPMEKRVIEFAEHAVGVVPKGGVKVKMSRI